MSFVPAPILGVVAVVAALGVIHGVGVDRWGPSGHLERAVQVLDRVPGKFGDWVGEDAPFDAADMARAGIRGNVSRRYRKEHGRETLSVLLVCGRGGPICVHTPDVCYAGNGFSQAADVTPVSLDLGSGDTHTFRTTRFRKAGPVALEIFWAWSRDGRQWAAPENPRLSFARLPALYKLYVVREYATGTKAEEADTCRAFLKLALPDLCRSLATGE